MKIGFYSFFLLLGFVASLSAMSAPLNEFLDVYVGGDAQIRRMKYKEGYGADMLPTHSPQGNIYAGFYLSKKFAFEAGYESTMTKKAVSYFVNGQMANGINVPPAANHIVFVSKARIKGFHFDLMYFQKIGKHSPWKFFAGIGMCEVKGTVERESVTLGVPPVRGRLRTFCKRYTALRASSGVQYSFDNRVSIRGTVSFVRTGDMKFKVSDDQVSVASPVFKPKDSLVIGLGGLYSF